MPKNLVCPQARRVYRPVAATLAVLFVLICAPRCAGQQPTATAVITDRATLPASNLFGVPDQFKLTGAGDVYFTSGGNTALFRWSQPAGIERLLQTNDSLEKVGMGLPEGLLDATGALLQANAGYAAFTFSAAIKGSEDPGAPVVYDGSSYRLQGKFSVSTFSELLLNASGRMAVLGRSGYWATTSPQRIEVETASGDRPVLVAEQNQPAPGTGGGSYQGFPQLIGFNDAGQLAFLANIGGGNTNLAIFLFDGTQVRLVAKSGTNPGDVMLMPGTPRYGVYYALNNKGQVAFWGIAPPNARNSIWIGDASGEPPKKLMSLSEPTEIEGWGNYQTGSLWLRGFNDSGKVLYDCSAAGGSRHALFLKALADPKPQVVFYRSQPGGPGGQPFFNAEQATLNNSVPPKVAFLARSLKVVAGSENWAWGWYLGEAQEAPSTLPDSTPPSAQAIAIQGDATPAGGTFGLAGRNSAALVNASGQVVFLADILDLNAVGLFSWTKGSGVTSVVGTNDPLPEGAATVLRAVPAAASDKETLVRVLNAGGQAAWYAAPLSPGASELRKIVAEFDQVPDLGTVVGPDSFNMNGKGEVVFTAALLGAASYPRNGILASLPDGGLKSVVFTGDGAPGGGSFTAFGAPQINSKTQVAFLADTADGTAPGQGIFMASPEGPPLQKVVRTGDAWPAGAGFTFRSLDSSLAFNDSGQVAFLGTRSNPGRPGLFIGSAAGAPLKIVEGGDPAPNSTFVEIKTPFKLNASGQVAFEANYSGGAGVFLGSAAGAPRAIVNTGAVVPGTGGARYQPFASTTTPELNSSGQVALCIPGGWFLGSTAENLAPRLLRDQPLPGGGKAGQPLPGSRFVALADSGEMAIYLASVTGGAQKPQVVIAGADGTLRKFVIAAETAEGTGSEFAKLYPTLSATPSGKFLFGAMLVNGPAKAGIFIDRP